MKSEHDNVLQAISHSDVLLSLVGRFATNKSLAAHFLADPLATLSSTGVVLQPDEVAMLRQVVMRLNSMGPSDRRRIDELTIGADKLIK
jgi:hypothetical protein